MKIKGSIVKLLLLAYLIIIITACNRTKNNEVILFDYQTSSPGSISILPGAVIEKNDSMLIVTSDSNNPSPGILISGSWDLTGYYELVIEAENSDPKVRNLPLTIRLENPGSDPVKGKGVFIDRIIIPSGPSKQITVSLPPKIKYPEIREKLTGMRNTPYKLSGLVATLDSRKINGLVIYIDKPRSIARWGIKRVVAKTGTPQELPEWMKLPADKFFPFIDIYGQFIHKEWPGKTKSDEDLTANLKKEIADLEAYPGPDDRDQFGGWKNGPKEKSTGQFYVKKVNGKWWMVDPEGNLFWSHGAVRVDPHGAVTPLDNREFYFKDLPDRDSPFAEFYTTHDDDILYSASLDRGIKKTYDFLAANLYRKYGDKWRNEYAEMTHRRLKSWGLNTLANSSNRKICLMDKTPYCHRISVKSPDIEGSQKAWWRYKDPFDPEFCKNIRDQLIEYKKEMEDPWCFGLFVDNEIAWGGETSLADWTLQSPSKQAAKVEFITRLKNKYTKIETLNRVWKSNYKDWEDLLESQVKPPFDSKADCIEFTKVLTEAYFKNVRDEIKKVAPHKLYLGCRYASSNETTLRIGAKYCDVLSYNIYAYTLSEFRLPEGIDKPVLIGEFHFGALDRGLFHPGLKITENQEARGKAYAAYVESALRHSNVIGTHWHQFTDQPTTGRFDGENFQVGLTDICDKPYPETIEKIREVGYKMYKIRSTE
jgi:hypothetical protein